MRTRLTTTVGQFSIVDGTVQEESPNLMVTRGPLGTDAGRLFIAVELVGHSLGEEQIYVELLQAISDAYYRRPGSVTTCLQEAIQEANALLVHANSELMQRDWLLGGVTCVFHNGPDVYIGQAGPSVAYVAQKGSMQRFPDASPWLQQPLPAAPEKIFPTPLGVHPSIHPNLFHAAVQPGDVIVLGTVSLALAAETREIAQAVLYQPIDDALYNMARLCGDTDVACMVAMVHPKGQPPRASEAEPPDAEESLIDEDFIEAEEELEPVAVAEAEETLLDMGYADEEDEPLPAAPAPRRRPKPRRAPRQGISLVGLARKARAGVRSFLSDLGLGFAVIGGWFTAVLRRRPRRAATAPPPRRDAEPAAPRRVAGAPQARAKTRPRIPWIAVAIAVPLVITLVVVLLLRSGAEKQRYEDLLQQSYEKVAAAQSAATIQEKHMLLTEALAVLDEARAMQRGGDPRAEQQAAQVQLTLDQVDGTVYLDNPAVLFQADGADFKGLVVSGLDVYLLDAANHWVVRATLEDSGMGTQPGSDSPVVVESGMQIEGYTVGDLLDEAWAAAGNGRASSSLLVLTQDTHLLEFSPRTGLTLVPVTDTLRWEQPAAIATYLGNLYVLDTGSNQIFRYAYDGGYDSPPDDWFALAQARDLRGAVDMAIDGAIYILYADWRLERYLTGEQQEFPMDGLAEPLQQLAAVYTDLTEEVRHVYVADPGAARVVQFTKEGVFVRQFRFADGGTFDGVSALHVDEMNRRLYFVAGGTLYACALPLTATSAGR